MVKVIGIDLGTTFSSVGIFNKDSELDNADKMRTLANVFEAHFKTVTGMWTMTTPGGPVPTPWISYG